MRRFLIFLAILVLLAAGVFIVLVMTLDEERAKRLINAQVKAQTGQELTIAGEMRWRLFPWLALEAEDIRLSNPPDFPGPDMLEAGRLQASVKLWPLLRREIRVGDIDVENAVVRLQTDLQGRSNLAGLAGDEATEAAPAGITTGQVRLHNVTLAISDAQSDAGEQFLIDDFQMAGFAADTPTDFEFHGSLGAPAVLGDIRAEGSMKVSAALDSVEISALHMSGKLVAANLDINMNGEVRVNPAPLAAELSNGQLTIAGQPLAIGFTYQDADPPVMTANLAGASLNLDQLLTGLPEESDAAERGDHALAFLRHIDLDAELVLDELIVSGFTVSTVQASARSRDGVLIIEPVTGVLAGGRLDARAEIDLRPDQPVIRLEPRFELDDIGQALEPWGFKHRLDGSGRLSLSLTTRSLEPDVMLAELTGEGQYAFTEGVYHGLDFGALVGAVSERDLARAAGEAVGGQTPFRLLAGKILVSEGVLSLPDLRCEADDYGLDGQLELSLADLGMDGRLRLDQPQLARLPLSVGGTLDSPRLGIDAKQALREEGERRLLDELRQRLE